MGEPRSTSSLPPASIRPYGERPSGAIAGFRGGRCAAGVAFAAALLGASVARAAVVGQSGTTCVKTQLTIKFSADPPTKLEDCPASRDLTSYDAPSLRQERGAAFAQVQQSARLTSLGGTNLLRLSSSAFAQAVGDAATDASASTALTFEFRVDAATAYTFGAGLSLHAQATLAALEPTETFLQFCIQSCTRSGTLAPGLYRVTAAAGDGSDAPTRSYGFEFRLDTLATPTPVPTSTPNGEIAWINPAGGAYGTAQNWDPPTVPGSDPQREDTAVFDLVNTYAVNVSGAKARRILIHKSSIDLVGGTAEATSSSPTEPSLVIGDNGKLHLVSGALTTVDSVLGDVAGGLAEIDLISNEPTWTNGGRLTIGDAAAGRLTIVSGQVTSAESRIGGGTLGAGEAIVGGPGVWTTGNLGFGFGGGAGTLEIKDGGQVGSDGAVIGVTLSTGNLATVTGSVPGDDTSPSKWTVDTNLDVGKQGAGQLDVLAGARVDCGNLRIATATSGAGDVRVQGSAADGAPPSTLASDFLLDVGAEGLATLTVADGGLVDTQTLAVGIHGPGTVVIEGERTMTNDPEPLPSILTAALDATVGVTASGEVSIRDGGHLGTPFLVVGSAASGTVHVDDATLATTDLIRIGGGATGTLDVQNGGLVFAGKIDLGADANGVGHLVVDGEDQAGSESNVLASNDVRVGVLGKGELVVRDGGLLFIQTPGRLEVTPTGGDAVADRGRVTVTGAGTQRSKIDARSDVRIGGRGKLEVLDGGVVTVAGAALLGGGGAGVLNAEGVSASVGDPSTVAVSGNVVVGTNADGGDSVLSATAGGRVSVGGTLFIGGLGSDDFVIIDGAAGATPSRLDVTGPIRISEDSLLSITAGATVTSASAIVGDDGQGTVAIGSAATTPAWAVAGTLDVGITGTGLLALCPGGLVTAGGIVHIGAVGTLQGTQTIVTPQLVNDGTVAPGCSPGTLTIDGAYVQSASGRLRVEVGGTAPGTFDVLKITGTATLGGTLEIVFVDGFVPRTGDALDVLQVLGSVGGDFAAVQATGLPPGWKLEPTRTGNVFGFRVFGDYLCYQTAAASGAKFPKALLGGLDTPLGRLDFGVKKPLLLCNPSGPSTGSQQSDDAQLRGYHVTDPTADPLAIAARMLRVTNGLHPNGELLVDTATTTIVLAAAAKCVDVPAGTCAASLPPPVDVVAYDCVPAKRSKQGAAFPKTLVASAVDTFGEPRTYKLAKPTRVCAPTSGDLTDALACYAAKPLGKACTLDAPTNASGACKSELDCGGTKKVTRLCAKQAKHARRDGLVLATALATDRAGTKKPVELCIPSALTVP